IVNRGKTLEISLGEFFDNMVYGVRDDGPGVVAPPHPPGPIGPFLRQLDPRARDAIIGWVLRQLAYLITEEAPRAEVYELGAQLMADDLIEALSPTFATEAKAPQSITGNLES